MGRNSLLAALLLACGPTLSAAEQWLRIGSPNFELYTTAGERKGKEAILYFEQMRGMFQKLNKSKGGPQKACPHHAFDSEKGYKPYRISDAAFAYYLGARDRDYIVMRNIASENYPVAIHEYFHLIVEHSGLALPIWVNEGLAEVYSPLKPFGKQVRMGDIIPGRYQQMLTGKWLSLGMLISVGQNSPFYNEKDKAGIFYSESWALSHMFLLSNEYWKKFPELLARLKPGATQEAAFQQVYGKTLEQMTVDLQRYLRGNRFNGAYFDVKLEKAAEEPDVRPATPVESGLALAELLAVTRKKDGAKAAYEKLARENPNSAEVELAWARMSWINQEPDEINRHFERAIALGTTDGNVYFDYAMTIREHGAKDEQVYALLVKAVELKPDLSQAHYFLGFYASKANRYGEAVAQFLQVKHLEKEQAYSFYRALAYGYYRFGNRKEAATYAEKAVKSAMDPKDAEAARELLTYVTRDPSKPVPREPVAAAEPPSEDRHPRLARRDEEPVKEATLPIEGLLTQVDCLEKSARLRVSVAGAPKAFLIQDPNQVVIRNATADGKHEFTCGPQKSVAVFLEYVRNPDPDFETEGLVRSIEFR